jgi:hypothetical protein
MASVGSLAALWMLQMVTPPGAAFLALPLTMLQGMPGAIIFNLACVCSNSS